MQADPWERRSVTSAPPLPPERASYFPSDAPATLTSPPPTPNMSDDTSGSEHGGLRPTRRGSNSEELEGRVVRSPGGAEFVDRIRRLGLYEETDDDVEHCT